MTEVTESETATNAMVEIDRLWEQGRASRQLGRAPNTVEEGTRGPCRYCGKPWNRWRGSKLDGHALCLVSPEIRDEIVRIVSGSVHIAINDVADRLGISRSVFRAWWRVARPR